MTQSPPLEHLEALVQRVSGRADPLAAEPMPGGASTRQFFRVALPQGGSAIGMYVPDATRSDEIDKGGHAAHRWPFLEVQELLEGRGIRVPRLLGEACEHGFILVEDLGDDTLARYLELNPSERTEMYRAAVRDLARAQLALEPLPADSVVRTRAFDEDLLRWEVDHFREWALDARNVPLTDADRETFARAAEHLAHTIASWPRRFVHRDYQSRNLMVRGSPPELVWIDFQDALLGPRVYDLVALLSDSYQTFDRAFIEDRLDEYAEISGLGADERRLVGREFDIVTVQRKLKDAGRFVFIDRVRKNPDFLQFVDPTIGKVRAALARLEDDPVLVELSRLLRRVFD